MANDSGGELLPAESPSEISKVTPSSQLLEPKKVAIASSESYDFEDVAKFLARTSGVVVTLLGDRDSGKSTLICSIYDRFLHGPFAGLKSAGPLTITGLEQRVHLERVESGREVADTQHTSFAEGLKYFHFGTCRETDNRKVTEVLISDRAGELYKDARGNPSLESSLIELPIADYLIVMVDGARVANQTTRAGSIFAVRQTLQMLADRQPASSNYQVQIVITKDDLIETASDAAELRTKIGDFRHRLVDTFGSRFGSLTFFDIAARAIKGNYPRAYGVDFLIQSWLAGPKRRRPVSAELSGAITEFDRFAERQMRAEGS